MATLLDPVPTTCPSSPPLQRLSFAQFGSFSSAITFAGQAPVWVPTPYLPTTPLHLNPNGYTPWPGTKIVWEVGPNYPQPVQVTVTNLATGQLAWWGQGSDGPSQSQHGTAQVLVLDAATSGPAASHGSPEQGWNEWGSYVYLLQADCYALDARWPGGQWRQIFAAGR